MVALNGKVDVVVGIFVVHFRAEFFVVVVVESVGIVDAVVDKRLGKTARIGERIVHAEPVVLGQRFDVADGDVPVGGVAFPPGVPVDVGDTVLHEELRETPVVVVTVVVVMAEAERHVQVSSGFSETVVEGASSVQVVALAVACARRGCLADVVVVVVRSLVPVFSPRIRLAVIHVEVSIDGIQAVGSPFHPGVSVQAVVAVLAVRPSVGISRFIAQESFRGCFGTGLVDVVAVVHVTADVELFAFLRIGDAGVLLCTLSVALSAGVVGRSYERQVHVVGEVVDVGIAFVSVFGSVSSDQIAHPSAVLFQSQVQDGCFVSVLDAGHSLFITLFLVSLQFFDGIGRQVLHRHFRIVAEELFSVDHDFLDFLTVEGDFPVLVYLYARQLFDQFFEHIARCHPVGRGVVFRSVGIDDNGRRFGRNDCLGQQDSICLQCQVAQILVSSRFVSQRNRFVQCCVTDERYL